MLCRDTERAAAVPSAKIGAMLAGGVVFVALAGLALYAVRPKPRVEAEPNVDARAEPRDAIGTQPNAVRAAAQEPPTLARERSTPSPTVPVSPSPVGQTADSRAAPLVTVPAPAPPSNEAIQAAFRSTPIVMFSTTWCPVCQRARAFLDANGLPREERDVDHDARALAELKRLTGKGSIPTFVVDGVLLKPGFSEESLMTAVVASVEKRLNFHGIRVRREQR